MIDNVKKQLDESMSTSNGHLKCVRQGIRSTSKKKVKDPRDEEADQFNLAVKPKFNEVYAKLIDTRDLEKPAFTDLTGAFPYTSSCGNMYIFVLFSSDINTIM